MCKQFTFCVNCHRFFLTIGSFLPFFAAKKWLEYTGFDCSSSQNKVQFEYSESGFQCDRICMFLVLLYKSVLKVC